LELFEAVGCSKCNGAGYKGRLGIHELLAGTDEVKRVIQRKSPVEEVRDRAIEDGMTTLMQDGIRKVFLGLTDMKQIRGVCIR
jgi:type II secretory ATPase GspE/PulE/Tfp pilus assembly ATPase PilB-like protein